MKPSLANRRTIEDPFQQQSLKNQQLRRHIHIPKIQPTQPHAFSSQPNSVSKPVKISLSPLIPQTSRPDLLHPSTRTKSQRKLFHLNTQRSTVPSYEQKLSSEIKAKGQMLTKTKTMSIKQYLKEHENKKLVQALKSYEVDKKMYKKKLATEVGEYVKLREHMQKFKKQFTVVVKKGVQSKERQNSLVFKRFLTQAIQQTKRKMSPKQFETNTTSNQ